MPKRIAADNETPRRQRGAKTAAVEADPARGPAMRLLLQSPKDVVAGALAFAAISAIITNALFLQAGRHPSPMFGPAVAVTVVGSLSSPLPRPRPPLADLLAPEPRSADARSAESRSSDSRSSDSRSSVSKSSDSKRSESKTSDLVSPEPKSADVRASDPMTNLVKSISVPPVEPAQVVRPPAPIPAPSRTEAVASSGSRRVAAVQRALTDYGYGQLKPTGTIGSDTQAAISKFEREHKMPMTGQMSDRLVRELDTMIGHAID